MISIRKPIQTLIAVCIASLCWINLSTANDTYPSQEVQLLSNQDALVKSGEDFSVYAEYNVSNGKKLTGIGIRIHYNSNFFEFQRIDSYYEFGLTGSTSESTDDLNEDNDPLTDRCVVIAWSSLGSTWPWHELPLELIRVVFKVKDDIENAYSWINVTASSTTGGYIFEGTNIQFLVYKKNNLDINNDGKFNLIDVIQSIKYIGLNN